MMSEDLAIGLGTALVGLTIQCVVVSTILRVLFRLEKKGLLRPTVLCSSTVLGISLIVLFIGNLLQVSLWGGVFMAVGEFQSYDTAFYHSIVNFATLGYGDLVMSERYRLLGGLEAATGVLMFGLTTGFLYSVLNVFMRRAWDERDGH